MQSEYFSVDERFCGPPRSGNGGFVCGRVARHLASHLAGHGPVAVRLKAPPPLATRLELTRTDHAAQLLHGATLIAEGRPGVLDPVVPSAPAYALAEAASRAFVGFKHHKFPGCFVCGTHRLPGDGLRIFPGAVDAGSAIAAPWIPDPSLRGSDGHVAPEFLWAALDCPGAFAIGLNTADTALVLGELCASVEGSVDPGEHCVVVGWPLGSEGRKHLAGTTVFNARGRLVAHARATWIEVPLAAWT